MRIRLLAVFLVILTGTILNSEESDRRAEEKAGRKARLETTATVEELAAARKEKIANSLQKGVEHYRKSEFELAIIQFNEILEIAPENKIARAYLERAQKYIEHKNKQELRRRQAEERKLLAEKKKKEKKQAQLQAQKERLAKVHIDRGDAYYRSRKLESAVSEWEKALGIHPENKPAEERLLRVKRELAGKQEKIENERKADDFIEQGRLYFRQKQYKEAIACWQKVLDLVPGNHPDSDRAESWIHVAEICRTEKEEKEAISKKDISERSSLVGITEAWLPRRRKAKAVEAEPAAEGTVSSEEKRKIEEKARQIISVNFENAHIRSVLTYLSEVSGVNIVLDEEVFPDVEGAPAEGQTSPRITIDLQDLPLIEALRVILRAKNLVHRMEENLVWITTPERMAAEKLVTKIYSLLRAVTGVVDIERPEMGGEIDEGGKLGGEDEETGETEEGAISAESVIDTLEEAVPWPERSFIHFDERTGNLVVRNTQTNLAILEELIRQIEGAPMQVSIEARFITVSTNELRQLGVEFPYLKVALGAKGNIDVSRDTGYGTDLSYITGTGFTQGQGLALSYTKLNPTQFQMFLDAIEKTESINFLSAPRVMTRNQQEAEIKVVDEYRFAEDWETFYYIYYADFNNDGIDEPQQGVTIVPSSFEDEPTEIGIILTVTPDIGTDMNITLKIRPIVNEFLGWAVYGVGGQADDDIAENYVQLQKIHESRIDTQIVVADGETIVMGGLTQEESSETLKKVPFLGDIPLLGRLFSRTATTNNRRSLLIFITTHLVKPTGERYST